MKSISFFDRCAWDESSGLAAIFEVFHYKHSNKSKNASEAANDQPSQKAASACLRSEGCHDAEADPNEEEHYRNPFLKTEEFA